MEYYRSTSRTTHQVLQVQKQAKISRKTEGTVI